VFIVNEIEPPRSPKTSVWSLIPVPKVAPSSNSSTTSSTAKFASETSTETVKPAVSSSSLM